jgi:glycosyltransferase involved in cell wall biosynthesis
MALQNAGCLGCYICSLAFLKLPWWGNLLPVRMQNRLQRRGIGNITAEKIVSIPWGEGLARVLTNLQLVSRGKSFVISSNIYDNLAKYKVDSCDLFHFVSGSGLHSAMLAKQRGSVIICDIRTPYPDFEYRMVQAEYDRLGLGHHVPENYPLLRRIKDEYAVADYFFVPSEFVLETFVQAGYKREKIFVVPYGVDIQRFSIQSEYADKGGVFRILFVGKTLPRKGIQYLLEAFENLGIPNAELCIIGKVAPEMNDILNNYAARLPNLKILGPIPHIELEKYYSQASVFVLPSVSEGSALVIYEAMASGIPIITTPNTGSIVQDSLNGFIVPPKSSEAIQQKLLWLYEHPGECKHMGKSAQERSLEFTWNAYGQRLLSSYEEILRQ